MEDKRQRVSDLLRAQVKILDICDIVKCSRAFVFKVQKLVKDGKDLKRSPGSGGHNKIIDIDFLTGLASEIEAMPTKSMVKLAKELKVSRTTIRRAVIMLGAHSYVKRRRQLLSEATKEKRLVRGKKLLSFLKKKKPSTVLIFSDKKNWTVDQSRNSRNDRYLAYNVTDVPPTNQTKHPASAMMLGVIASDGNAMPPHWFPKGLRMGATEYLDVMKTVVKPWLDATYPQGNFVWQQDSAPGHKAKVVQEWCRRELPGFWPHTYWPPSSPDCSPLDFSIWGYVESRACANPHPNVDSLKASVEAEWANMDKDYVVKVCRAFRPRLEAMVDCNGDHFE